MSVEATLQPLVAERCFEALDVAGERQIVLRLGVPERDPAPGGDWRCRYEITVGSTRWTSAAYGVDSLQALLLALAKARAELLARGCRDGLRLTWLGQDDLGLPSVEARRGP